MAEPRKAADLIQEKGTAGNIGVAALWHFVVGQEEGDTARADQLVDKLWNEKDKNLPKAALFLARSTHKNNIKKFEESL